MNQVRMPGDVGLIVFASDGTIVDASETLLDVLGGTRDDLLARRLRWDVPALPASSGTQERTIIAKNGCPVHVVLSPPEPTASGTAVSWICEIRPGTDALDRDALLERERDARERAEAAHRMKDEFLATLSHELRTPLNAIVGWSSLLAKGGLGASDQARGIEVIHRNALAQAKIVDDLLDVSRVIAGKLTLELEPVQVSELVRAAVESARPTAVSKGVELGVTIVPPSATVIGDSARLQQVMWNLLSNAVKFTTPGGRVEVRAETIGGEARISVTDDGRGIEPDFLPFVFDRFRQADGSLRRREGGLGLGLAIVRQLVELHGGRIEADSPGPGRGATFCLFLRAVHAPASTAVPGRAAVRAEPLAGARVLVVVHGPEARDHAALALVRVGAEVRTAASADDALAVLDRWRPDVIVSDISMPDRDGHDLLREVRASGERAGGWVPAIALGRSAGPSALRDALLAGFQLFIAKPFENVQLIGAVAKLRDRARLR